MTGTTLVALQVHVHLHLLLEPLWLSAQVAA